MTPLLFLGVTVAGGVGAALRLLVETAIGSRSRSAMPWGTFAVNVSGSLLLGLITGLVITHALPDSGALIIGTGLLGGYTTFSTASFETVRLIREGRYGLSFATGVGMLLACVGAAGLGLWVGQLL